MTWSLPLWTILCRTLVFPNEVSSTNRNQGRHCSLLYSQDPAQCLHVVETRQRDESRTNEWRKALRGGPSHWYTRDRQKRRGPASSTAPENKLSVLLRNPSAKGRDCELLFRLRPQHRVSWAVIGTRQWSVRSKGHTCYPISFLTAPSLQQFSKKLTNFSVIDQKQNAMQPISKNALSCFPKRRVHGIWNVISRRNRMEDKEMLITMTSGLPAEKVPDWLKKDWMSILESLGMAHCPQSPFSGMQQCVMITCVMHIYLQTKFN